jgi:hypothetical protein
MIAEMAARASRDPVVRKQARFVDLTFAVGIGPENWLVHIDHGNVSATQETGVAPAFTLQAAETAWADFAKPTPPPGTHDILALFEGGRLDITGSALPLMRNLQVVKLVLDKMRGTEAV